MSGTTNGKILQWPTVALKVADLTPYERNPRNMAPGDYERLKASLIEYGYATKILATRDNRIIGGHARIRALKELGIEEIEVTQCPFDLTEEQYRRLILVDNIHNGTFDMLLIQTDFTVDELEMVGFDGGLIAEMFDEPPAPKKEITDTSEFVCLVEFDTEEKQRKFYNEMKGRAIKCKLM